MNIEHLKSFLNAEIVNIRARLATWSIKFDVDPGMALDNSTDEFIDAACLQVYDRVLKWLSTKSNRISANSVREYALSIIISNIKSPRLTHSVTSTLYHQGLNRAWANVLDAIGMTLDVIKDPVMDSVVDPRLVVTNSTNIISACGCSSGCKAWNCNNC